MAAAEWTEERSREVLGVLAIKDADLRRLTDERATTLARFEEVQIRSAAAFKPNKKDVF
jgi:hypothetical protein